MTIELVHEKKIKTPMLDKMLEVKDKSQTIGDFLEWIGHREPRLYLCEVDQDAEQYYPSFPGIEKLLAEFFGINLDEAERERRRLLDYVRNQNDKEKIRKSDK
jgi:hypothetical protein